MSRETNILTFSKAASVCENPCSSRGGASRHQKAPLVLKPRLSGVFSSEDPLCSQITQPLGTPLSPMSASLPRSRPSVAKRSVSSVDHRGKKGSYTPSQPATGAKSSAPLRSVRASTPGDASCERTGTSSTNRRTDHKKDRSKRRADRLFTKHMADQMSAQAPAPERSRAAVYKTQMGTRHRRAARMQSSTNSSASEKKRFSVKKLVTSPKCIASMALCICLALSCVFLYPAAAQLYHAVREHDRLSAEYAAIEGRNAALSSDVASLKTDTGVETRAHAQFGWVEPGEQTANVRGLSASGDDPGTFRPNITPGSVAAPTTWYSPLGDALFGSVKSDLS